MLSSECCSSGNNLVEANHVIMTDIITTSAKEVIMDIEKQAIGRAVRLGQNKPVIVTRFIMRDTIEEEHYNNVKYNINDIQ
jgi:SNF2 family DNA or RNA helicase